MTKPTLEDHLNQLRGTVSWANDIQTSQRFAGFEVAYYTYQSVPYVLVACDWQDFDSALSNLLMVACASRREPVMLISGEPTHYDCDRINDTAWSSRVSVIWLSSKAQVWQTQMFLNHMDGLDLSELFGGTNA